MRDTMLLDPFVPLIRRWIGRCFALLWTPLILAIGPIFLIRVQSLNTGRIGHEAANTEIALSKIELGLVAQNKRGIDLWVGRPGRTSNQALYEMRRRDLKLWSAPGGPQTASLLRRLGATWHLVDPQDWNDRDLGDVLVRTPPTLTFTPEELSHARGLLSRIAPNLSAPWVCLHARDSAYLASKSPWTDWSYHDYRDSDIENYVLAAETLAEKGYYVFRVGEIVKRELPSTSPRVVDYAASGQRDPLLDLYLSAYCSFFLATGSGIDAVPRIFRRPRAFTNLVPYSALMVEEKSINIFKHHVDARSMKPLSQTEIQERGLANSFDSSAFRDAGVAFIDNTPAEIREVALEMADKLQGRWTGDHTDNARQEAFWKVFPRYDELNPPHLPIRARVGMGFLRENEEWCR